MSKKPTLVAELIAEFLGTFVLILFGTGVVAMVVLFPVKTPAATFTAATPTSRSAGDWRSPWESTLREKFLAAISTPPSPSL